MIFFFFFIDVIMLHIVDVAGRQTTRELCSAHMFWKSVTTSFHISVYVDKHFFFFNQNCISDDMYVNDCQEMYCLLICKCAGYECILSLVEKLNKKCDEVKCASGF